MKSKESSAGKRDGDHESPGKESFLKTKEEANLSTGNGPASNTEPDPNGNTGKPDEQESNRQPAQNGDDNEPDDNGINPEPEQKHQDAGPKIENADEDEQNPFPDEMRPNWHK